jgi:hypothetical protein
MQQPTIPYAFRRTMQTAAALAGLLALSPASASIVTHGCSGSDWCTLAELEAGTAYININGVVFNNFAHDFSLPVGAGAVRVTGSQIDDPAYIGTFAQLRFEAIDKAVSPWAVNLDPLQTSASFYGEVSYQLTVLSGFLVSKATFDTTFIDQVGSGSRGNLTAEEIIAAPDWNFSLLADCLSVTPLPPEPANCNGHTDSDLREFAMQSGLSITNKLRGSAARDRAGLVYAGMEDFENTFFRTPEPGTLALALAALLGAGAFGQKRRTMQA